MYNLNMNKTKTNFSIGIDLGASKISGAIIDEKGKIYDDIWQNTKKENIDTLFDQIDNIIFDLKTKFDREDWWEDIPIGIGLAGTVDFAKKRVVFSPNIPILENFELTQLENKWKNHHLYVDNDAKCALVAEMLAGEATHEKNVILLTLGTGVGGAIAIDGKLYRGKDGKAGELGQTASDWQLFGSTLGAKGTFEQILGGKYLKATYHKSAKDLFYIIEQNQMHPFFDRYVDALTAFLLSLEKIFAPDLFLLSGSICESGDLFLPKINNKVLTNIKIGRFKKLAGTVGAGLLAIMGEKQQKNIQN